MEFTSWGESGHAERCCCSAREVATVFAIALSINRKYWHSVTRAASLCMARWYNTSGAHTTIWPRAKNVTIVSVSPTLTHKPPDCLLIYYIILYCTVLYIILYYIILYYITLHYIILYYIILYYITLYYIILYYIILYYIILYNIILYYIILY